MATEKEDEPFVPLRPFLGKNPSILRQFEVLTSKLRLMEGTSSHSFAKSTAVFLRNAIGSWKLNNMGELIHYVREVGSELVRVQPLVLVVGNVIRRVLNAIREGILARLYIRRHRCSVEKGEAESSPSDPEKPNVSKSPLEVSEDLVDAYQSATSQPIPRRDILDAINELIDEIDNIQTPICSQALDHIHYAEVVMTFGCSTTVLKFLKTAAAKREFEVVVSETAPVFTGQELAKQLVEEPSPISTTTIPDSSVLAVMPRVNKVVIGAKAILANGGVLVESGGNAIALAAKHHSVPVVCVTGLYKLCPQHPHDRDAFNMFRAPDPELMFLEDSVSAEIEYVNPAFDFIPPELITLLITDAGGLKPSHVDRLLDEMYSSVDADLEQFRRSDVADESKLNFLSLSLL